MNEPHWAYIVFAYAVTVVVISGVSLRIVLEHRRLRAELARLDKGRGEAA